MDYLISVIDERTDTATASERDAVDAFNERLRTEGRWVYASGLADPTTACIIDGREGRQEVEEGPLIQTIEYPTGLWVVTAGDEDQARELALAASAACNRKVELRPSFD